ncbi:MULTISPECIES: Stk1 family PASTA domain-containing Ser/Thr kinase [unclassified Curtobacterium]|uniref:Stk1 family PASTA domain-containing Ser/Thr kinase n=1 Tax=unclassified Curtobacterium TaxID=257496 RepID=UPI001AE25A44|nr:MULTISPECIES: Stk1 family PASTA domain-containing Ser/Thr kinase [unclassified Curtobacterium]MBP1300692.1 serine/threonine-protein kinase [Curtobacterium sp. 1310]MDT0209102.1 Stk1 family PASTA domain-containing Ser/Thr kinase [Curtobacterium sp. BRD11]
MTTNAATDPMIGRMIDQRYRVRSRIARGGMATVYLATDVRLERRVAIKIMHGHLADDQAFRERFIQEARSAARLSHPNLVGVYDQGAEDDTAYIVMEYIPGITLRDLLQEHRALTPEQATDILRAVLAGLASAHRAGIVHRDLKPENVLLADDGRIKLGDFGLARATTANTATGAALLGTIAYLSPELVTRGAADSRSDIYALGIMLYEMLTGEQPYKGDQPMQIAYQHANDTVPVPSAAEPGVPPELDDLVAWATARDPADRPRDAREMLDHMSGNQQRATGQYRTAVLRPENATAILPAGSASPSSADASGRWDGPEQDDATRVIADSTGGAPAAPARRGAPGPRRTGAQPGTLSPAAQRLADKSVKRRKRGWILLAVVVVLAIIAGVVGWALGPGPWGNVRIPEVAGKSVAQARQLLQAQGLQPTAETDSRYDAVVAKGQVSTTKPAAEREVRKGTPVRIVVSDGPRMIALPAIVGQPLSTVTAALDDDFQLQDDQYEFSADAPEDTVIAAKGLGTDGQTVDLSSVGEYAERGPVTLTVSLGAVPDVTGKTLDGATAALDAVGLVVGAQQERYSDDVPKGQVISSSVEDSPAVQGSAVDLVLSKGPTPITLPDVAGKTIDEATSTLENLGLDVKVPDCTNVLCRFYDWKSALPVTATDPVQGSTVYRGDTITLSYEQ